MGCGPVLSFVLFLLVTGALPKLGASPSSNDTCAPAITAGCIAGLAKDMASLQSGTSQDKLKQVTNLVNGFMTTCVAHDAAVLRPLRLLAGTAGQPMLEKLGAIFSNRTGYQVTFDYVPELKITAELLYDVAHGLRVRDGWFVIPSVMAEMQYAGAAAPLDSYIASDASLQWSDMWGFFRDASSVYNGQVLGMPISGKASLIFYRQDVLSAAGLEVPATWQEVLQLAKALNGSDFNGDGRKEYALCLPSLACIGPVLLGQILAPMTQVLGLKTGWLLDPSTFTPLINTEAGLEALRLLQALAPYSWPDTDCNKYDVRMSDMECALGIRWDDQFQRLLADGVLESYRFAPLPGSERVLNRVTGKLEMCTSMDMCPSAVGLPRPDGTTRYINRAPYIGYGGITGMVNALQPPDYQEAAYKFFSFMSSPEISMDLVADPRAVPSPFRYSQLLDNPRAYASWVSYGYNMTILSAYLDVYYSETAAGTNTALDMRFLSSWDVGQALAIATYRVMTGAPPAVVQAWLDSAIRLALNSSSYGIAKVRDSYLASLGVKNSTSLVADEGSSGNKDKTTAAIATSLVGAAGCALAVVILMRMQRGRRKLTIFGKAKAPRAGSTSTLLVTDIENSTGLWEALPQETMNACVELHHRLIRDLLRQHCGYESATEGDSFIAAFHSPTDALAFSTALQLALRNAHWPQGLLDHTSAAPVWAVQVINTSFIPNNEPGTQQSLTQLDSVSHAWPSSAQTTLAAEAPDPSTRKRSKLSVSSLRNAMLPEVHSLVGRAASVTEGPLLHSLTHVTSTHLRGPNAAASQGAQSSGRQLLSSLQHAFTLSQAGSGQHSEHAAPSTASTQPHAHAPLGDEGLRSATVAVSVQGMGDARSVVVVSGEGGETGTVPASPPLPGQSLVCSVHQFYTQHYMMMFGESGSVVQTSSFQKSLPRLVFRGLRVRVGIHTGIPLSHDVVENKVSGRVEYRGVPLALAKATCDAGYGGMVLLSGDAFAALPPNKHPKQALLLNMGDVRFTKDSNLPTTTLYQAVPTELEARLALLQPELRGVNMLAAGVLAAPLGEVTVTFTKLVGASTLLAWNRTLATEAIELFQAHAMAALARQGSGYLVELAAGLCLAVFGAPGDAAQFGLELISGLRTAEWNEELLAHELCEEVLVAQRPVAEGSEAADGSTAGTAATAASRNTSMRISLLDIPTEPPAGAHPASFTGLVPGLVASGTLSRQAASSSRPSLSRTQQENGARSMYAGAAGLLFRGPRVKMGADLGQVHAAISPAGRLCYRGRVMNRAARIADKAGSGQVWCSSAVWTAAGGDVVLSDLGIEGNPLGQLPFKGLLEPIDVVHVHAAYKLHPVTRAAAGPQPIATHSSVQPAVLLEEQQDMGGETLMPAAQSFTHSVSGLPMLSSVTAVAHGAGPTVPGLGHAPSMRRQVKATPSFYGTYTQVAVPLAAAAAGDQLAAAATSPGVAPSAQPMCLEEAQPQAQPVWGRRARRASAPLRINNSFSNADAVASLVAREPEPSPTAYNMRSSNPRQVSVGLLMRVVTTVQRAVTGTAQTVGTGGAEARAGTGSGVGVDEQTEQPWWDDDEEIEEGRPEVRRGQSQFLATFQGMKV